jgi:hypothetical protein
VRASQHRVRSDEGSWCDLRLTPYRTADNRIDGVVLTVLSFEDLNEGRAPSVSARATAKGKKKTSSRATKRPKGKK